MTKAAVLLVSCVVAVYCLHRLASWAEDRGWIYYRRDRGRSGSLSGAALEIQSLLQPSAKHVLEERRRVQVIRDDAGDAPGDGPAPRVSRHGGALTIRSAVPEDLPRVLRLNSEWEHVTSRLDEGALDALHRQAAYHRVVETDGEVVAFLLALPPGAAYDSPNYRWFDGSRDAFLYIDRIVVGRDHQRAGLGARLYDDLLAFAKERGVPRLVCEVDVEPMNAASDAFHARRGFAEVGSQRVALGTKMVSLRECAVG